MNLDINKYFEKSDNELFLILLTNWGIKKRYLKLYGKYTGQPFLSEVIFYNWSNDEESLLEYPYNLGIVEKVYIESNADLKVGHYYEFVPILNDLEIRQKYKNPFLLKVDKSTVKSSWSFFNKRKEFIKDWFAKKGRTPEDASTIAGQLTLNGLELYTETERFIFELIQNADDVPLNNSGVKIEINKTDDFLMFMHNGQYFLRNNVKAIADAAKSTKKIKQNQTGYKGIGFKSVFTDADCVYINSGGYSFKFDKNYDTYNDCIKLYEWHLSKLTDEAKREEKQDLEKNKHQYQKIENIPWQIKPIWVENHEYSDDLRTRGFFSSNVSIALEIGKQKLNEKKYEQKLINLFNDPRFILFLRNVRNIKLDLSYSSIDINVKSFDNTVFFYKNSYLEFVYYKSDKNDKPGFPIDISEDNFQQADVDLKIRVNESTQKREFIDFQNQPVSNIPEKLANAYNTVISFAIETEKRENHEGIKKYPKGKSILFNYLPTSDAVYEFPFLVNADFVTETNRQKVLKENKWNHFLFYHIGYNHIIWASQILKDKSDYYSSYLNVIVPQKLKIEGHDEICNAFNRGFAKALQEIPFILSIDNELKKADEVIIDKAEISKHFSSELFYALFGSELKIVHHEIDVSKLSNKDFGIKRIEISDFCEKLKELEGLKTFNEWIENLDLKQYEDFIGILNDKYLSNKTRYRKLYLLDDELNFQTTFWKLKIFIGTNKSFYSANDLHDEQNIIPRIQPTFKILKQLIKLDFISTPLKIDTKENIYNAIEEKIKKHETIFDLLRNRIETIGNNEKLTPLDKKQIFENFMSRETKFSGVSRNQISKLEIFFNSENPIKILTPTNELLSRSPEKKYPKWLEQFQIFEDEYYSELDSYKFFIQDSEIYQEIIFSYWLQLTKYVIDNEYPINLFYKEVIQYYKLANKEDENGLTSLNEKAFIYGQNVFLKKEDVFYHSYLSETNQYETIKSGIKKVLNIAVPELTTLEFLTKDPFNLKRTSENNQSLIQNVESKINELSVGEIRELFLLIQKIDSEKAPILELFHDQQGNIKSLCRLLSSASQNLPYWLDDFKIAKNEYYIDYETLFLEHSDVYTEIILPNWKTITEKLLTIENPDITLFYNKINDDFFETGKQIISGESRAFIYSGNTFELKEAIFWHPNFSMAEAAIEKLTNRKLPYENIVKHLNDDKSPFHIAKADNLLDLLKSGSSTALTEKEAISFIAFATNINLRIFDSGYFDDTFNYNFGKEVTQFNLLELNTFIVKHFAENYCPIPESLVGETDLSKLGLISNDNLKTEIVNKLSQKQEFADLINLVSSWGDSFKKLFWQQFESKIKNIVLSTSETYSQQSFEYKLLKLYLSVYNTSEAANNLRNQIFINEISVAGIETKEDISIGDTKLPYNTIIKAEDNSKWFDKFITEFNDKELESKFFYKAKEDIHTTADLLKATTKFTDLNQYVFAIYYAKENDNNYLSCFENPFSEVDILNHFYTKNYPLELIKSFLKIWTRNYVYPNEFALKEVEYLPTELKTWHNDEQEKITYLSKLGLNSSNSNIVKLRKHLKNSEISIDISNIPTSEILLNNTLKWVESEDIVITRQNYEAITKVYQFIPEYQPGTPVLIYNTVENEIYTYKLKASLDNPVYGFEELNGKSKAFELLIDCDIINGIHQSWLNDINKKNESNQSSDIIENEHEQKTDNYKIDASEIRVEQKPDIQKLTLAEKQEADFQKKWSEMTGLVLYFFSGQIPYLDYIVGYNTEPISVSKKTSNIEVIENEIYVNKQQKDNLQTLLNTKIEVDKSNMYFLWERAYRLLHYLKQEDSKIEIDFEIKEITNELLAFILNKMNNHLFLENTKTSKTIRDIYHNLHDSSTEIIAIYKSYTNETFSYQLVNSKQKKLLVGLTECEKEYYSKILEIAGNNKFLIVADFCKEFTESGKIEIIENQLNLNVDELKQWEDDKWTSWHFKDKYTIKLYPGKIPLKTTFLDKTITEYENGNKFRVPDSNTIIVNEKTISDLHIWLKDELSDEEYAALFTRQVKADETIISKSEYEEFQRWKKESRDDYSKQNKKQKQNESERENNFNDRFYEIAEILNPGITGQNRIGANLEAKIAILQWLEAQNEIKKIEEQSNIKLGTYSLINNVEFNFNNSTKTIIAKSARKSNLKINPNEWLSLADKDTILIIWFGGSNFKQINEQNTLIEENPNTLIRIDKQDATIEQITNLASVNQYISTFKFVFYSPANISDEVSNLKATNEDIDVDFDENYLDNLDLQ